MANLPKRVARLVPTNDPSLSIDLHEGLNRIGRQRIDNHIVLVSPQVSRFHAEIEVSSTGIFVRDLASANGTFVNNVQIKEQQIREGDLVAFSDQFTLRLQIDQPPAQPDSVMLPRAATETLPLGKRQTDHPRLDPDSIPPSLQQRGDELKRNDSSMPAVPAPTNEELTRQGDDQQALDMVERERQQLAALYQISKKCMSASSLPELDRLLINVLERTVAFDRGFITYQLPSGDWKLVMAPKGISWDRELVRQLLERSLESTDVVQVPDSRLDPSLGQPGQGTDQRLLLPLRTRDEPIGMIFVISTTPNALRATTVDFLSLFSEIAALAIVNCPVS